MHRLRHKSVIAPWYIQHSIYWSRATQIGSTPPVRCTSQQQIYRTAFARLASSCITGTTCIARRCCSISLTDGSLKIWWSTSGSSCKRRGPKCPQSQLLMRLRSTMHSIGETLIKYARLSVRLRVQIRLLSTVPTVADTRSWAML